MRRAKRLSSSQRFLSRRLSASPRPSLFLNLRNLTTGYLFERRKSTRNTLMNSQVGIARIRPLRKGQPFPFLLLNPALEPSCPWQPRRQLLPHQSHPCGQGHGLGAWWERSAAGVQHVLVGHASQLLRVVEAGRQSAIHRNRLEEKSEGTPAGP